jgi:hypothetical protein
MNTNVYGIMWETVQRGSSTIHILFEVYLILCWDMFLRDGQHQHIT